jgi:gliding motility-associated-like protein
VIEVTWDLRPGIYRIAVKEQLGSCEGPWVGLDVEVVDNPKRTLPETIELCEGDSVLLDAGIGYSDYRWQDNSMAASFLVRNSGVYWVRTENSCNTRIDSVSVQVYQKPYFTFETPSEVLLGNNVVVRASDPSFVSYNWICDALGNFNAPESPEISFVAKAEITEIQLCVTDIHNCKLSQGLSLHANPVLPEAVVTFSEFTPNRDGVNDAWTVVNLGFYPGNHLTVFGRNGQLVFAAKPYQNDWRGTYLNTETDLPVGAYYFVLELNSCYTLKGNVNIVR